MVVNLHEISHSLWSLIQTNHITIIRIQWLSTDLKVLMTQQWRHICLCCFVFYIQTKIVINHINRPNDHQSTNRIHHNNSNVCVCLTFSYSNCVNVVLCQVAIWFGGPWRRWWMIKLIYVNDVVTNNDEPSSSW